MIYLASLYSNGCASDSDLHKEIRQLRYEYTLKRLAEFMSEGYFVFSPIAHCKVAADTYGMPHDYEFYKNNDRHFVGLSEEVWVLMMEDDLGSWELSHGIQDEIKYALDNNIPVKYIHCSDYK